MLYLLDANVLIDAHRDYYPIDRIPQFWEWLHNLAVQDKVKIPLEIFQEVTAGRPDELVRWMSDRQIILIHNEEVSTLLIETVIEEGYGLDFARLNDQDVTAMGQDPFLIAYAMADPDARTVVSNEGSKPSKAGSNRHIPDACNGLRVRCIKAFDLIRELDFRT